MDDICNRDAIPPHGDFYVTVRDGRRTGFLLGPYEDIGEALENVRRASLLAGAADPRAAFYAFGCSRLPIGTRLDTVFGK